MSRGGKRSREWSFSSQGTAVQRLRAARGLPWLEGELEQRKRSFQGQDLPGEVVELAQGLVRALAPEVEGSGDLVALLLALLLAARLGSTRLRLAGGALPAMLGLVGEPDPEATRRRLQALLDGGGAAALIGGPGEGRPLVREGQALYLERLHRLEERFARALAARILLPEAPLEPEAPRPSALPLSAEQEAAVDLALRRPLAVITGGPGTGKTSIVVRLVQRLLARGLPPEAVALAAPTGKAAQRLGAAVHSALARLPERSPAEEAFLAHGSGGETLHRLLGYSPALDRFQRHAGYPLPERAVIVDESSMIDLSLMERLLCALRPEARLVLLGDAEQLPSVEAGTVLRDVSGAPVQVAARLSRSYRVDPAQAGGRHVLAVAAAVNAGEAERLFHGPDALELRRSPEQLTLVRGVEWLVPPEDGGERERTRERFLARWYRERAVPEEELFLPPLRLEEQGPHRAELPRLERLFAALEQRRLLAVTRGRSLPTGAESLNAALHRFASRDAPLRWPHLSFGPEELVPGEVLLMEHNDYERRLYNGDQGVVLLVERLGQAERRAVFRAPHAGGFAVFDLAELSGSTSLAYALTVHKAQGSEYDGVALVLPDEDLALCTREIIYTALTRARQAACLYGRREVLERAVARRVVRESGVEERLSALLSSGPEGQSSQTER